MNKVYKIRDRHTGLFSTGGMEPKWTTKGKVWGSIGAVKNHLRIYTTPQHNVWDDQLGKFICVAKEIPDSWELITYEYIEEERSAIPAKDVIQ